MLRILIAEDDMVSRKVIWRVLEEYGECDLVVNGIEAIDAFMLAWKDNEPYDLICLDIMMPKLDGVKVLKTIRDLEMQTNVPTPAKIIMVTALSETDVIDESFENGADAYANKPLDIDKFTEVLRKMELAE